MSNITLHAIISPVDCFLLTMSTLATIKLLVKEIGILSNSLSDAMPKGSKDDKIWSVTNAEECDTPHETFNRRFDALFAEDCRDSDGRLHHLRQGKLGMGLVMSYLSKINWTSFPFDLMGDLNIKTPQLSQRRHCGGPAMRQVRDPT